MHGHNTPPFPSTCAHVQPAWWTLRSLELRLPLWELCWYQESEWIKSNNNVNKKWTGWRTNMKNDSVPVNLVRSVWVTCYAYKLSTIHIIMANVEKKEFCQKSSYIPLTTLAFLARTVSHRPSYFRSDLRPKRKVPLFKVRTEKTRLVRGMYEDFW